MASRYEDWYRVAGYPMIGRTLSHFVITAKIGEGGMGQVYRARDTRLGREVAIKVLPDELQADEGRRQRLAHEAESISQLQHPNICALYDIGHEDGVDFLVMELLAGETLAHRLRRASISVDEALAVGAQVAGALERAHRHSIVHRDLKPGNVMLTPDGPKVLDFGLAKEFGAGLADVETQAPTALLTEENQIVGTIHYMAPEQLQGQPVDARADIFALGCLLYEMLSGSRPFAGDSQASVIAAVLDHDPPPLDDLEIASPPGLGRVVERCLSKDPEQRWQSAADVQTLLTDLTAGKFSGSPPAGTTESAKAPPPWRRAAVGWAAAAVAFAALATVWIASGFREPEPEAAPPRVERHTVDAVGDLELGDVSNAVLSPDGDKVVFVGNSDAGLHLYLRRLNELSARRVKGTDDAGWATFSPDGEELLFFDVVKRNLKRISIHGGTPTEIISPAYLPAAWETDGYIYYTPLAITSAGTADGKGLWRIAADGGDPEQLTRAEQIGTTARYRGHYAAQLLPGGRHVLFSVGDGYPHSGFDTAVLDLGTRDWRRVFEDVHQARVVDGKLVFWRDSRLWATPFDLERMEALAAPKPILDGVARHPLAPVEVGQYQITATGDLVYVSGASAAEETSRLVFAPFDGDEVVWLSNQNERLFGPRLSPDGKRLAFDRCLRFNSPDRDCRTWILEPASPDAKPINMSGYYVAPVWEASGRALISTEIDRDRNRETLVRQPLDGGTATILLEGQSKLSVYAAASHRDRGLIYGIGTRGDFEIRQLSPDGSVETLVGGARQAVTDLSPDGRWLVLHSARGGQFELYTLDLDATDRRPQQITSEGALFGHFAPDGRSLYFRSRTYPGRAEILRAPFDSATGRIGEPESVMATAAQGFTSSWWWLGLFEVTDDGLVLSQLRYPERSGRVVLVRNWFREMAERLR